MTIYTYTMLLLNVCLLIDWCLCRHAEQDEPHPPAAVAEQAGPAALQGEAQDEGDRDGASPRSHESAGG